MIPFENIKNAHHILILVSSKTFADGSALYTHILREHKKVSIVSETPLDFRYAFLPWYDKVRSSPNSSADLTIDSRKTLKPLYSDFQENNISINAKMATAFYASYLLHYEDFFDTEMDGIAFALISKLIEEGAEYHLCNENIKKNLPLARFRLKAILLKEMLLVDDGQVAIFTLKEKELQASGATLETAQEIMQEALSIAHVELTVLLDENNELIKLIYRK